MAEENKINGHRWIDEDRVSSHGPHYAYTDALIDEPEIRSDCPKFGSPSGSARLRTEIFQVLTQGNPAYIDKERSDRTSAERLGAFWPLEWKLVIEEAARRQGSCITCSAWWSRKNRCTAAAEGNGPGRHWHASEVAKPPWCPGWRPKPAYDDVVK